ncbi:MAG: hypothetical protein ACOZAA_11720 [Pseudomonadota bacterium]
MPVVPADEWIIEQAAQQRFIARGKRAVVLIYTAFGPAVGGVLTITVSIVALQFQDGGSGLARVFLETPLRSLAAIPMVLVLGALCGYWIGGTQALACGLILAAISGRDGRFGYFRAGLSAALVAILATIVIVLFLDTGLWGALFMVAAGLPSSLILRFLFRKRFAPVRERG